MKKFISVVLIVACLGLSACKSKDKYNKDSINSAFYSYDSIAELIEEREYIEFFDLNDELYDEDTNDYFDDYEDIANEIVGDKLIYQYDERGDYYAIMDIYGFYGGWIRLVQSVPSCQGLYCSIRVFEDPTDDLEGYEDTFKAIGSDYDEFLETSKGVRINYGIEEFGKVGRYNVLLSYQDTKKGNIVIIMYTIPTEDNEEEIQELRNLGIPVITDYIE